MAPDNKLATVSDTPAPAALKPPVEPATLAHRDLLTGEFWRRVPAYAQISEAEFLDHRWQAKNSITNIPKLLATLEGLVSEAFIADAQRGFERAPMSVRVSPYLLSLIDWSNPDGDPLRTQFIPLGSRLLPDHPRLDLDSLHERADMPVPGLTHRYTDKALFLALDTCPVYCRFCTRSYAVGIDTDEVEKFQLKVNASAGSGLRLHPLAPRAGGHRDLGRRRLPARAEQITQDRRDAAVDPSRAPHALRHQGPGGHAAEDPDRRRLDRRADPRRGGGPQAATRRWCCTPTSTTRARSRRSPRPRWTGCSSAASRCATRRVLQRRVNDSVDT